MKEYSDEQLIARAAERKRRGREWWSELDDNGKIERLRAVIKTKGETIQALLERVSTLESMFHAHFHDVATGRTAVLSDHRVRSFGYGIVEERDEKITGPIEPNDVFF